MVSNYIVINLVRVRSIGEILTTQDHVHVGKWCFLYIVLPAVIGRCCSQLACNVDPTCPSSEVPPSTPHPILCILYLSNYEFSISWIFINLVMSVPPVLVWTSPRKHNTCNITSTKGLQHIEIIEQACDFFIANSDINDYYVKEIKPFMHAWSGPWSPRLPSYLCTCTYKVKHRTSAQT